MGRGLLAGALALPLVGLAGCEPGEGRYIDDTYFTDTQLVRQADVVYGEAPPLPEALQIDPDDIAASGSSAGAVTALNLAYNAHHPGASNPLTESSAIGAAVVYSGAAYGQLDPNYPPVADIGPGDAPTMDAHCTNDLAVDWNLTKAGIDAAVAAGLVASTSCGRHRSSAAPAASTASTCSRTTPPSSTWPSPSSSTATWS